MGIEEAVGLMNANWAEVPMCRAEENEWEN
jgi:hypothetical protein